MFRGQKIHRRIAAVVLVAFTASLSFYPLQAAAQAKGAVVAAQPDSSRDLAGSAGHPDAAARLVGPDERMSEVLAAVYDELKVAVPQTALSGQAQRTNKKLLATTGATPTSALRGPAPGELVVHAHAIRARAAELRTLYPRIEQAFVTTEQRLRQAELPATFLDRQRTAVGQYMARKAEFERLIGELEGGNCAAAAAEMYWGVASTLAILSTLFHVSSKSVEGLVYKLIGSMYGADLFKSVAGSRACH